MLPNFFNVGWLGSLGSLLFPSLYESRQALTSLQKSWYVDWFSGNSLKGTWTKRNIRTSCTFGMSDSANGGFVFTGTGGTNEGGIDFNNIRHYSNTGSVIIGVNKISTSGDVQHPIDLIFDPTQPIDAGVLDLAGIFQNGTATFYAYTGDASTQTLTSMGFTFDTNYHKYKAVLGSSNVVFTIDDGHTTTNTTNLPTKRLQPRVVYGNGTGTMNINYLEVYNT